MARGFDVKFLGDKKLIKMFRKLELKTQKVILDPILKDAAKIVKVEAQKRTTVGRSKPVGGHMRDKIRVRRDRRNIKNKRDVVGYLVRSGTRKELGIPASAEYYYPSLVELGFKHAKSGKRVKGKRAMIRALKENKERLLSSIRVKLGRAIIRQAKAV